MTGFILCASMMPVEKLPAASWETALGLGFVSVVFDNIPLTALALKQGGYDWDYLAFILGWHPNPKHKGGEPVALSAAVTTPASR